MGSGNTDHREVEILIIGGGMAGLMAARDLQAGGRDVLVLDKGRGFGGRMAVRNIGAATFEHGAHFLEARTPRFAEQIDRWCRAQVAGKWYQPSGAENGPPFRYRATPSISALARHLAQGTEVLRAHKVIALELNTQRWTAKLEHGGQVQAAAVLMTCPVPQSLDLLDQGSVRLAQDIRQQLESVTYERCLTVMAVLDGLSRLTAPGILTPDSGPIDRLCDHHVEGASAVPAVTIQAGHRFSLENWDRPRDEVATELLAAAQPWLGGKVTDCQIHGWKYCRPLHRLKETCLQGYDDPPLIFAGDAFGGHDLESAAHSGWAAAAALMRPAP
jgi:predicted NAD/FAD-dependent oxidoreductase|nr:FAD-dependent oxidoreductase [Candidatus Krumholzibacteria bacterium]